MYTLQRNYCSTGKSKLKRSHTLNMEHYSCSKVTQSNTASKGREMSQPLRLKELYKSPNIPKSAKKGPVREKSKPERLTLTSGVRNTESVKSKEGSRFGEKDTINKCELRESNVRRKLNLNFSTPYSSANKQKSVFTSNTINTKHVQNLNTTMTSKLTDCQTKKITSNNSRMSFLMPPNTLKNKYLVNQAKKDKDSADNAKTHKLLPLICQDEYLSISGNKTNSTNLQNFPSKMKRSQEPINKENQKSETNNNSLENTRISVNTESSETTNNAECHYQIASVQTLPVRKDSGECTHQCVLDGNISGVHFIQNPHSQMPNSMLNVCINFLSALRKSENDNSCKCEVQNATIGTTTLKQTLTDDCEKIYPLKVNVATVKANLRNLIRTTEESLAHMKLTLSCIENLSRQQDDNWTDIMLHNENDQANNNKQSNFVSTESIRDCITPEINNASVNKAVQAQMNTSNDHSDNTNECFEILSEKDLQDLASDHSGTYSSHESLDVIQLETKDDNKENCKDIAITDNLDKSGKLRTKFANLCKESNNDSFLALENELNILYLRPNTEIILNSERTTVGDKTNETDSKEKCEKSFKEYMLLKSNLNCLETPNVKKFRSLSYRDTKSVPSSMHKTYMSSKVLAELQNLYTDSPDS